MIAVATVPRASLAVLAAITVIANGCAGEDPYLDLSQAPTDVAAPEVAVDVASATHTSTVATAATSEIVAYVEPGGEDPVSRLANPIPSGSPLVFEVISAHVNGWHEVKLPIRPNGSTGWIKAEDVTLASNPWRLEISVADHQLRVFREGRLTIDSPVAIGTGATPTPIGSFYLTELLQPTDPSGPYGTFAFGLSGFSETLMEFNGGEGVIGIHGTNDPGSLGTDVSHGCIRIENSVIDEMATFLPLGTPVLITP